MSAEMLGRFEVHTLPNGDSVYYDDAVHAYYGEVKESKAAKGGYSFVRESRFIGVSTPGKALDPNADPLMGWAARLERQGIAQLVTEDHEGGARATWLRAGDTIHQTLEDAGLTWRQQRDDAASRGTDVHELILGALAEGKPPSLSALPDEARAYGQGVMRWWRDVRPTPLHAEQVTADLELRVAGRFDLLCEIDGEVVLVDAKTRENGGDRKTDHIQLAGYQLCNRACGYPVADRALILVLTPDGEYEAVEGVGVEEDFLTATVAHRQASDLAKRIRASRREEK